MCYEPEIRNDYPVPVSMDLDEGRFLKIGCMACRGESQSAYIRVASPIRAYWLSADCEDCGEVLFEFDQFMGVVRAWRVS